MKLNINMQKVKSIKHKVVGGSLAPRLGLPDSYREAASPRATAENLTQLWAFRF